MGALLWTVVQAVILLIKIPANTRRMIAKIASINSACAIFNPSWIIQRNSYDKGQPNEQA
ncbi:hypothetical protein C4K03_5525 [Pseudomonas synxantha]|uniref:Uncharacterized protein n=1 Tax=Pseudomonas synxantha TaxID=47883 RepID=A0A3G7UGG6_9PSED|nr:hypothetical protein C4K03_5525 [Pseudomonas synxantha]